MPHVWLNNELIDEAAAAIPVRDMGLLHGAGVFTTLRAYSGQVFRIADHLRRLRKSCEAFSIPLPYENHVLTGAVSDLLAKNALSESRLRLTVTRGVTAGDGEVRPTVLLSASAFEAYPASYYHHGMTVIVLDQQKLNPYDVQAGHKTLNYFSRFMALRSAAEKQAGEALWFNVHNYLQSGSVSNVFVVKDGKVLTPPTPSDLDDQAIAAATPYPRSSVLPGITRQVVLELCARNEIEARPAALDINALLSADEVFLTNSIMGVMPVCRIERKAIGDDQPGPVYRTLAELYEEEVRSSLGGERRGNDATEGPEQK